MGNMINYTWKILKVFSDGELITGVKYSMIGTDNQTSIVSEGNHQFIDPELKIAFADVTEKDIIDWLEKDTFRDGQSHVKSGIERQFNALIPKEVDAPWMPATFTIGT